jgi:hypothetical protein
MCRAKSASVHARGTASLGTDTGSLLKPIASFQQMHKFLTFSENVYYRALCYLAYPPTARFNTCQSSSEAKSRGSEAEECRGEGALCSSFLEVYLGQTTRASQASRGVCSNSTEFCCWQQSLAQGYFFAFDVQVKRYNGQCSGRAFASARWHHANSSRCSSRRNAALSVPTAAYRPGARYSVHAHPCLSNSNCSEQCSRWTHASRSGYDGRAGGFLPSSLEAACKASCNVVPAAVLTDHTAATTALWHVPQQQLLLDHAPS